MTASYCDRCPRGYAKPGVIRTKSDSLIADLMTYEDAKFQKTKVKMLMFVDHVSISQKCDSEVSLVSGPPVLGAAAARFVKTQWRFLPGTKNGTYTSLVETSAVRLANSFPHL